MVQMSDVRACIKQAKENAVAKEAKTAADRDALLEVHGGRVAQQLVDALRSEELFVVEPQSEDDTKIRRGGSGWTARVEIKYDMTGVPDNNVERDPFVYDPATRRPDKYGKLQAVVEEAVTAKLKFHGIEGLAMEFEIEVPDKSPKPDEEWYHHCDHKVPFRRWNRADLTSFWRNAQPAGAWRTIPWSPLGWRQWVCKRMLDWYNSFIEAHVKALEDSRRQQEVDTGICTVKMSFEV